jgi:hypothetical protein
LKGQEYCRGRGETSRRARERDHITSAREKRKTYGKRALGELWIRDKIILKFI